MGGIRFEPVRRAHLCPSLCEAARTNSRRCVRSNEGPNFFAPARLSRRRPPPRGNDLVGRLPFARINRRSFRVFSISPPSPFCPFCRRPATIRSGPPEKAKGPPHAPLIKTPPFHDTAVARSASKSPNAYIDFIQAPMTQRGPRLLDRPVAAMENRSSGFGPSTRSWAVNGPQRAGCAKAAFMPRLVLAAKPDSLPRDDRGPASIPSKKGQCVPEMATRNRRPRRAAQVRVSALPRTWRCGRASAQDESRGRGRLWPCLRRPLNRKRGEAGQTQCWVYAAVGPITFRARNLHGNLRTRMRPTI